jgi:GNAT superfamily N-acetyltransferase
MSTDTSITDDQIASSLDGLMQGINSYIEHTKHSELRQFNEWFYSPIASVYVRYIPRHLPVELFQQISMNDDRSYSVVLEHVKISALELGNFSVNSEVRQRGIARALIQRLGKLADEHGLYFMLENVHNPFLLKHMQGRTDFVPRETDPVRLVTDHCFFRKYRHPE